MDDNNRRSVCTSKEKPQFAATPGSNGRSRRTEVQINSSEYLAISQLFSLIALIFRQPVNVVNIKIKMLLLRSGPLIIDIDACGWRMNHEFDL